MNATASLLRSIPKLPQSPDFWASLVILCFLVASLVNIHEYGVGYDELIVMRRGGEATELFQSLFSNTPREQILTYATYQHYPSFYAFVNYQLSALLKGYGLDSVAAGHVLNILTGTLGLVLLFVFVKRAYNSQVALWSVLFLALFPRFVAHAHYNSKDVPVMVFSILTLHLLCTAHHEKRCKYWMLAGLAFGLSINAKLDALLIVPIFFGAWVLDWSRTRPYALSQAILFFGGFLGIAALTVFALWPMLWIDPLLPFKALGRFSGTFNYFKASYLGELYPINAMPWHYMSLHLLAVTPLPSVLCILVGIFVAGKGIVREHFFSLLLALWIILPLLIRLYPGVLQYDGMRHVFIVVPALMILAAIGLNQGISLVRNWPLGAVWQSVIVLAASIWLFLQNVISHPYQGSYLNEPVRQLVPSSHLGGYFDFYSWDAYLHHGVRWLNTYAPASSRVLVPERRVLLQAYSLRPDLIVTDEEPAEFIMFPAWRSDLASRFSGSPAMTVQCSGANLLLIYRLPSDPHSTKVSFPRRHP